MKVLSLTVTFSTGCCGADILVAYVQTNGHFFDINCFVSGEFMKKQYRRGMRRETARR
jgi:hypothetical protein